MTTLNDSHLSTIDIIQDVTVQDERLDPYLGLEEKPEGLTIDLLNLLRLNSYQQGQADKAANLAIQAWGDWRDQDGVLTDAYRDGYDGKAYGVHVWEESDWQLARAAEGADSDELLGYAASLDDDERLEEIPNRLRCNICEAENHMPVVLGVLGSLAHLRCRSCGSVYNRPAEWVPGAAA